MSAQTCLLAGIDEAGLGPLLGPLSIGYSVFRVPVGSPDLWSLLRRAVAKDPKRDGERFIVTDSKKVFTRNERGRKRLERTALGFLSLLEPGRKPITTPERALFGTLAPPKKLLSRHPWYAELPSPLPLYQDAKALELAMEKLHRALQSAAAELIDAGVRLVPAGELNSSFAETESKGATLWHKTAEILKHLWKHYATQDLTVSVDRHGGRLHYSRLLGESFPRAAVQEVRRGKGFVEYRVTGAQERTMKIAFAERCEERSFTAALASCLAKYARELCMEAFNSYFAALQPDLKPTAGYTTDGRRWVEEAAGALRKAQLEPDVLMRKR